MSPGNPNITSDHVDNFKARFVASLDTLAEQDAAQAYFHMREADGRLNISTLNQYPVPIHAEAALMAIGAAATREEAADDINIPGWKEAVTVAQDIFPVSAS